MLAASAVDSMLKAKEFEDRKVVLAYRKAAKDGLIAEMGSSRW
jgi:hypothetical protein